jgi:hypothetical protein
MGNSSVVLIDPRRAQANGGRLWRPLDLKCLLRVQVNWEKTDAPERNQHIPNSDKDLVGT